MTSLEEVSKTILALSKTSVSNLKLQKLLYYVQGWRLGLHGVPAFDEEVQAWVHGPVVPAAFREYRHFRWNNIDRPAIKPTIPNEEEAHIQSVLDVYGVFSAVQLEQFSHQETPWIGARRGLGPTDTSRAEITKQSMQEFFAQRANG